MEKLYSIFQLCSYYLPGSVQGNPMYVGWEGLQPPGPVGFRFLLGLFWLNEAILGNLDQLVWSVNHSQLQLFTFSYRAKNYQLKGHKKSFAQKLVSGCHFCLDLGIICPLLPLLSCKRNFVILKGWHKVSRIRPFPQDCTARAGSEHTLLS